MARYTDTQEFSFGPLIDSRTLVVSGQVTINVWDGQSFILSDTKPTGAYEIFTQNTRVQIVPDVTASYWIDERGGF